MTQPTPNRRTPAARVLQPLQEFLQLEAAGGLVLMVTAAVAMTVANSPLASPYLHLLKLPIGVRVGSFEIVKPATLWINDGLMAVFFFLVGLELKREVIEGHMSSLRQAALPIVGAVGGMVAPALIYTALNRGDSQAMQGWAIPMATGIAFALGVLSLLGKRVPAALKTFLLSVAIIDDLGAILIIAFFYTSKLSMASLAAAAVLTAGLALLNRAGVRKPAAYILLGIPLWLAVLKSGVHATLAGVVTAMFIPLAPHRGEDGEERSLLRHLEHALHPWVAFGVLPIFAFANAGVSLNGLAPSDIFAPMPLGIMAGLFFGNQIGIMLLCWPAARLGLAALPDGVGWRALYGAALLCGVGFTMSLFIASLAFEQRGISYGGVERLAILLGSFASGLAGYLVLRLVLPKPAGPAEG